MLAEIKAARTNAELTQDQVASILGTPQSTISKIESGERRIDMVEFLQIMQAIKADPLPVVHQILAILEPKTTISTSSKKRHRLKP